MWSEHGVTGSIRIQVSEMRQKITVFAAAALVLSGCATMGTKGQARLEALETRADELAVSLDEANSRLDELDGKLSLLNDKLDRRLSSAAPAKDPSRDFGAPPDLKVVTLDPAESPPGAEPAPRKVQGAPGDLYRRAMSLLSSDRVPEGREALLKLQRAHPDDDLADNALYWVAESYYSEKAYEQALKVFTRTAERYPEGNKAPELS